MLSSKRDSLMSNQFIDEDINTLEIAPEPDLKDLKKYVLEL